MGKIMFFSETEGIYTFPERSKLLKFSKDPERSIGESDHNSPKYDHKPSRLDVIT